MKIAILAPMRQELAPVVAAFSLQRTTINGTTMHTGTTGESGETAVVATTTGIGTAGAKRATQQVLDLADVDHVMIVGIAGGVGPTVKIGDLIFPDVVVDRDSGAEYRPTHLGNPAARGTIVTSDDFLVDPGLIAELSAAGVIGLDMETAAVAEVCTRHGCAWSVIRAISDMATDHPDDSVVNLAKPDGSANGPAVAKFLLTKPWRIPQLARFARDHKSAATAAAQAAARVCASG